MFMRRKRGQMRDKHRIGVRTPSPAYVLGKPTAF